MRRAKTKLPLWFLLASGCVLASILLFSLVQQAHAPGTLPGHLMVIQDQALPPDSIVKIYQNGRVKLEAEHSIWWSEDSRSVYFRAFQNTWEYCLSCQVAKPVTDRYPSGQPPTADMKRIKMASELILLNTKNTALYPATSKTGLPKSKSWDGWAAYQDEAGCWKLAGYLAREALLVEWVSFCQVDGLEGLQPVQGRLSPDGKWAAFAAGRDSQSFEAIWLIFLNAGQ